MKRRLVLFGFFLAGALLMGVGGGIAFGEYSSFRYLGETRVGREHMVTETLSVTRDLPPGSPVHTGSGNGVCASSHGGCGFYGGSAVRRSAGALRHGLSGGRADGGSLWGNPQLHRPDSSGGRPFISGKKEQKTGGRPGLTAGTGRGGEST